MIVLETPRLLLREFVPADAEPLYRLNLDPDVMQYTGDPPFSRVEEARAFIARYDHYRLYGFGRWAVLQRQNGEFLGWCGLKYTPERDEYDIGFRFFKAFWNRGFATEAAGACVSLGFRQFCMPAIVGRARKENTASIRVLEKIGLIYCRDISFDDQPGVLYKMENPQSVLKSAT